MGKIKKCAVCGREFTARTSAVTCSKECQKIRHDERTKASYERNKSHYFGPDAAPRSKAKIRRADNTILEHDLLEASKRGLSYGQYKALQYQGFI